MTIMADRAENTSQARLTLVRSDHRPSSPEFDAAVKFFTDRGVSLAEARYLFTGQNAPQPVHLRVVR